MVEVYSGIVDLTRIIFDDTMRNQKDYGTLPSQTEELRLVNTSATGQSTGSTVSKALIQVTTLAVCLVIALAVHLRPVFQPSSYEATILQSPTAHAKPDEPNQIGPFSLRRSSITLPRTMIGHGTTPTFIPTLTLKDRATPSL